MSTIVREWRGRVPREKSDDYMKVLQATGLKNYAATPGHRGTLVLRDDREAETEYTLLTFWESEASVRAFAGDDPGRAVYYPEDNGYLIEKPERLRHYRLAGAEGPVIKAGAIKAAESAWPLLANWR